jgi:hypothetical protein
MEKWAPKIKFFEFIEFIEFIEFVVFVGSNTLGGLDVWTLGGGNQTQAEPKT